MRVVIAVLFLMIQLRPLAGALVCFEQAMATQEGSMPEHGAPVTRHSGDERPTLIVCTNAALCGPLSVAVFQPAATAELAPMPLTAATSIEPIQPRIPPVAPPFHPPRARPT